MSLADTLERAASALPEHEDAIRPANGDPSQLLASLGPEAGAAVLTWLLANEPDGGAELAFSWVEEEAGAQILMRIDDRGLPKPARKGLRKALHRLRSRGVSIERPEAEPMVARLPEIEDDIAGAHVSAIDPRGTRVVYLVDPNPAGGARLFEILLDERRGIVDFEVYSAGRSRIRRFVKEAVDRSRFPAVVTSPDSVRALVARIADRHPKDRAMPTGFGEWRSRVAIAGRTPGDLVADALADVATDEAATTAERLATASELVRKGAIGPWGPPTGSLAELTEESLAEMAAHEAGAEDWSDLTERIFDRDEQSIAAERLEESAYVLWKLEREDDARACLAAALTFRAGAPRENPVALTLTEVLLTPALEGLRTRAKAAGELANTDGTEGEVGGAQSAASETAEEA